ncbi:zinc-binding alcohol dehydrogenase family protein [Dysgonomonadaceae bacterium zrk40]|nr:zinc-binding alcohol dehydrogenase family protein [Dysgonomonadaceae bacterium zrk40]
MKAVKISAVGQAAPEEKERPVAQPGEVLLKVVYAGFCGSDLNTYLGMNPMVRMPVIPGHEISAVVEQVTEGVPANIRVGMRCTVNPYTSCGNCPSCRNGRPNACQFNQTLGVQRDGAMCEQIVVPWQKVITADNLNARELVLVEPLSVGFHAVARGAVTDLDVVMVIGCGMIGTGAIIRAALRGARVIAVDLDHQKLELAKQLGATDTIHSKEEDLHTRLMELTGGMGPDVVIEAVGSPSTYRMAIDEVAFTGRVVCIGYAKSEVSFETKYFVSKELDIRGSRNALPEDFRAVIAYIRRNRLPASLITAVYPPEAAGEALQYWSENRERVIKIILAFE